MLRPELRGYLLQVDMKYATLAGATGRRGQTQRSPISAEITFETQRAHLPPAQFFADPRSALSPASHAVSQPLTYSATLTLRDLSNLEKRPFQGGCSFLFLDGKGKIGNGRDACEEEERTEHAAE